MPYRHLFRQHDTSYDFNSQHAFQGQPPQLSIVDLESTDYTGWHEMDFTTATLTSPTLVDPRGTPTLKSLQPQDRKQSTPAYRRPSTRKRSFDGGLTKSSSRQRISKPDRPSGDIAKDNNQQAFSQLVRMESECSPISQSIFDDAYIDNDSAMMIGEPATLSALDSVNSSPTVRSLNPTSISLTNDGDSTEPLCPLIAGMVDTCQPSRCGPAAPCMNFTTLPPIEDCTSIPCIADSQQADSDSSMEVEVHPLPRPSKVARTSTTTTSRSSATTRSSSSPVTTPDSMSQVDIVPLPSRKSKHTTTGPMRRQTRSSTKSTVVTAVSVDSVSDNEAEADMDEQKTKTLLKANLTAASKLDSKLDSKQRAKAAHSLVERKYRENLNAKIAQLHITLQSSHYGPRLSNNQENDFDQGVDVSVPSAGSGACKARKSEVLTEAMNYINHTEVEMRHMENEIAKLGDRVRLLEKLVRYDDCNLLKGMGGLQVQRMT